MTTSPTPPPTLDSSQSTAVEPTVKWKKIGPTAPFGSKVQVINRQAGVSQTTVLRKSETFWTHWAGVPVFDKDEVDAPPPPGI